MAESKTNKIIKEEAQAIETKSVTYDGLTFEFPADVNDWPAVAIMKLEDEKPMSFIRAVVSPESFNQFLASSPTMRQFGELADLVGNAVGGSGN